MGAAALWSGPDHRDRSFFGVISTRTIGEGKFRVLIHGTTVHGAERLSDVGEGTDPEPLTYYAADGPLGTAIRLEQSRRKGRISIGVVGLGVGSLACYRRDGESWRFYEIDPAVVRVAKDPRLFTFLSACAPEAEVIAGDARMTLATQEKESHDVLLIDAFSSDAVPVHLLTREALRLYATNVGPGGIVLMHVSNRFMDLANVVAATAAAEGLAAARMTQERTPRERAEQKLSSDVVAIAADPQLIAAYLDAGWRRLEHSAADAWTDDYSNVIGAILRKRGIF
jgi:hypothetical protein